MIASISAVAERGISVDIRADLLLSEGVPIETLAGCSVRQRFPAWGWYNGGAWGAAAATSQQVAECSGSARPAGGVAQRASERRCVGA